MLSVFTCDRIPVVYTLHATAYSEDKNCRVAAANTASPHVAVPLQLVNLAKGTCLVCSLSYGKGYTCY